MNKDLGKRLLSLSAIGTVLVLALISAAVMNMGIAWLSENDTVDANGMSVSVNASYNNVQLKSHPVSSILDIPESADGGKTYTFESDVESYELPLNDPNGITYYEYMKALVIIIEFDCKSTAEVDISLTCPTSEIIFGTESTISNCIEVAPATLSGDGNVVTVESESDFKSLVTVTKESDGSMSCTKETSVWLESMTIPAGNTRLCFVMQYYQPFLKYAGIRANGQYTEISFTNDITFYIVEKTV